MGNLEKRGKKMARLVVAALFVCALAYGSDFDEAIVPEYNDVEPSFQEDEVFVQATPEVPAHLVNPVEDKHVEVKKIVDQPYVAVPKEAGDEDAYRTEKANQHSQEQASNSASITDAERSAGLKAASDIMRKRQQLKKEEALKHQVAYRMNYAAELAAIYKKKVQAHANAKLMVKKAKLVVEAQVQIVKHFREQLKAAQKVLRKKQSKYTKAQEVALTAKYNMEKAMNDYRTARKKAISADNAEKEREREKRDTKAFKKVAEEAVVKAAAAATAPKKAKKAKKAKKVEVACADCTTLPKAYKGKKGPKGTCADCPTWAKSGFCTNHQYSAFMGDYCKKSCQKYKGGKC